MWHARQGWGCGRTANLGLGAPLLAASDVDKVKGGMALGETDGKVAQVVAAMGASETGPVGHHLGHDLRVFALVGPLPGDGAAQGIGRLFAALDALSYPSILKLPALSVFSLPSSLQQVVGGLTSRPSPSIKITIYGFRVCANVRVKTQYLCRTVGAQCSGTSHKTMPLHRCPSGRNGHRHHHHHPPCMCHFPYIKRASRIQYVIASARARGARRLRRRGRSGSCAARLGGDLSPGARHARGPGSIIEYPTGSKRFVRQSGHSAVHDTSPDFPSHGPFAYLDEFICGISDVHQVIIAVDKRNDIVLARGRFGG